MADEETGQVGVLNGQAGTEAPASVSIPVTTPEDAATLSGQSVGEQQIGLSPEDEAHGQQLLAQRSEAADNIAKIEDNIQFRQGIADNENVRPLVRAHSEDIVKDQGEALGEEQEKHDSIVAETQAHVDEHLPEYKETARQAAEADGKHINIGETESLPEFELSQEGVSGVVEDALATLKDIDDLNKIAKKYEFTLPEHSEEKQKLVDSLTAQFTQTASILDRVAPHHEGQPWEQVLRDQHASSIDQTKES